MTPTPEQRHFDKITKCDHVQVIDRPCDGCHVEAIREAVAEERKQSLKKTDSMLDGLNQAEASIKNDARKKAFREFDAKYGLVHAENCSRYGYCDIFTPCTCGLDDLRKEMSKTE